MSLELHLFSGNTGAQRVARLIKANPKAKVCCVLLRTSARRVKSLISGLEINRVVFVYPDAAKNDVSISRDNLSVMMITIQEVLSSFNGEKLLIIDGLDVLEFLVPSADFGRFFIFLTGRIHEWGVAAFLVQPKESKVSPVIMQSVDKVVKV